MTWRLSIVGFLPSFVEVLQECWLILKSFFIQITKSLEPGNVVSADRSNMIKNECAPYVSLLDIIQSLIAGPHKPIDIINVPNSVMLSPVGCQLLFCLFGVGVLPVSIPMNNKWHISAPLPKQSQALHVSFNQSSWSS